jgi:hypothetical protein
MSSISETLSVAKAIRLDLAAITHTAQRLCERVHDRFPGRGISRLSVNLVSLGGDTQHRLDDLCRPRWILRFVSGIAAVAGVAIVIGVVVSANTKVDVNGVNDTLSLLENAIQDLVFVGFACVFIFSIERRMKRRAALRGLAELRSLAHVVDMHQLAKTPESALNINDRTAHSAEHVDAPPVLVHYLDYCSEMLSIINKMAAMYAQELDDSVVLDAVVGVQDLTNAISSKLWQKIMIIEQLQMHATGD